MKGKVRKTELIMYGYGTRTIFELDKIDLQVDYPNTDFDFIKSGLLGKKLKLPKFKNTSPFNMKGVITKISYVGKKYLKKLK